MAVVYRTEEEQEKQGGVGQGVQTSQNQPTTGGGVQSTFQGSTSQPSSTTTEQKPGTASGSYTNLQSYLDANKNAGIGQTVANKIQGEADQARQAQSSSGAAFRSEVDQAIPGINQDVLTQVQNDARSIAGSDQQGEFERMRDAQYQGPSGIDERQELFNPAYKETTEAGEYLDLSKTGEGRKSILGKLANKQYSAGQKKLDNLLLQNDPNARENLASVRDRNQDLSSGYDTLLSSLSDYASQAKDKTQGTKNAALEALQAGITGQQAKAAERLTQRQADAEQAKIYRDMLRQRDFTGLGATPEERAAKAQQLFGIDTNLPTYRLDPGTSQWMSTIDPSLLTTENVRSDDESATLQALQELGADISDFDLSSAGTYDDEPLYNFSKDAWGNEVAVEKQRFLNAENSWQAPSGSFWNNVGGKGFSDAENHIKNDIAVANTKLQDAQRTGNQVLIDEYNNRIKRGNEDLNKLNGMRDEIKTQFGVNNRFKV